MSPAVDASDTHLGVVLQQLLDGAWALLSFYSRKLSVAEKKYSAFDSELLAANSSLRHFCFMLEGRGFTIFTDHNPLTHALFGVSLPWSTRQQFHLSYLAEFISSVVHIPGPENVVADTLSRLSLNPSPAPTPALVSSPSASALVSPFPPSSNVPGIDFSLLPPLRLSCSSVQEMKFSPSLSVVVVPLGAGSIVCGSSTGLWFPYSSSDSFLTF